MLDSFIILNAYFRVTLTRIIRNRSKCRFEHYSLHPRRKRLPKSKFILFIFHVSLRGGGGRTKFTGDDALKQWMQILWSLIIKQKRKYH